MDARWVAIARLEEIPLDRPLGRTAGGRSFALVREGPRVFAVQDRCPHLGHPLSDGAWDDGLLVCSHHGWRFDPRAGAEDDRPPEARCVRHAARVRDDGTVEIDLSPIAD